MSTLDTNEALVEYICERLIYRQPDGDILELLAAEMQLRQSHSMRNENYEYRKIKTTLLLRKVYQQILSQEFPALLPDAKIFWQQVFEFHLKAIDTSVTPRVP